MNYYQTTTYSKLSKLTPKYLVLPKISTIIEKLSTRSKDIYDQRRISTITEKCLRVVTISTINEEYLKSPKNVYTYRSLVVDFADLADDQLEVDIDGTFD
jgi:hypothetical protein